jgi:hypothetical protein
MISRAASSCSWCNRCARVRRRHVEHRGLVRLQQFERADVVAGIKRVLQIAQEKLRVVHDTRRRHECQREQFRLCTLRRRGSGLGRTTALLGMHRQRTHLRQQRLVVAVVVVVDVASTHKRLGRGLG